MENHQILRPKMAAQYIGLSRSGIYARLDAQSKYHDPHFPKPVKLGSRSIGFFRAELDHWLQNR